MIWDDFPVKENDLGKIEKKTATFSLMNFVMKIFWLVFPKYISDQKCKNSMDLLFVTNGDKLHYGYIKDFDEI